MAKQNKPSYKKFSRCSKRDNETWIDGSPDDTSQWVPGPVIKPVVEAVEALLCEKPRCPVVEVGVKLVNHTLKA